MSNRYEAGPPEFDPVDLADLKAILKIQNNAQDVALEAALAAAIDLVERYTARYLAQREVIAYVEVLRLGDATMASPYAWIKRAPVFDGAVQEVMLDGIVVPPARWRLKIKGEQAQVHLLDGVPTRRLDEVPYPLKITFKAGYKAKDAVPAGLKRAALSLAAYLFNNPGDCSGCGSIPASIKAMLSSYTIRRIFG